MEKEEKFNMREKLFMWTSRLKKRVLESALDEVGAEALNNAFFELSRDISPISKAYGNMPKELRRISENLMHLTPDNAIKILYASYLKSQYREKHPERKREPH